MKRVIVLLIGVLLFAAVDALAQEGQPHDPNPQNVLKEESYDKHQKGYQERQQNQKNKEKVITPVPASPSKEFEKYRLSGDEKALFEKAMKSTATKQDKEKANNICAEKCPICFDGRECDFNCAKEKCK